MDEENRRNSGTIPHVSISGSIAFSTGQFSYPQPSAVHSVVPLLFPDVIGVYLDPPRGISPFAKG
jgi:hypothetical protein